MNLRKLALAVVVAGASLLAAAPARAQRAQLDQDVIVDSVTIRSVTLGTASFVQLDTAHLDRSFWVLIQNLDTKSPICVSFDSNASSAAGAGNGCVRIDSSASGFKNFLLVKRWAQNLVIYAKSLNMTQGSSEVVILQGR